MSRSVLISIQPEWCKLIANERKTLEIRKSRPKLETPFKVYIYCTKNSDGYNVAQGKVIGEFICDKIYKYSTSDALKEDNEIADIEAVDLSCVPKNKISDYEYSSTGKEFCINNLVLYFCHISDLLIYDKPKELTEFGKTKPPQSWCYID